MKRWEKEEIDKVRFLMNNYNNKEIANILNVSSESIRGIIRRNNIKRSSEALKKIMQKANKKASEVLKTLTGDKNPNWKNGISKNNYHYKKLQIERYPEKNKARRCLYYAVKSGKLKRGKCEICGSEKTHAHHDDYSKPLEVRWFCIEHHRYHVHKGKY